MGSRTTPCPAHRAALATITRISFTLAGVGALGGCIESPHGAEDPWLDGHADGGADGWVAEDAQPPDDVADAMADDTIDVMVDGWVDARVDGDAPDDPADAMLDGETTDAVVWSETTPCPSPAEDPEAWQACCEAKGWSWEDPNCAAWGPPLPPRMLA